MASRLQQDSLPEEMLSGVFKGVIEQSKIDPALVNDITVGTVLAQGGGATNARMAALHAGFPESTAISTVNCQCSSGLQAVVQIATAIQTGLIEIGIGAGFESMTKNYGATSLAPTSEKLSDECASAADCPFPWGNITSENVASDYKVSRAKQDEFAASSHTKALEAQKNGWFNEEIIPVKAIVEDKDGNETTVVIDKDDGIRPGTTAEKLAKLRPAFDDEGTTTAGNASQVSDGAAAVLLMKRKTAEKLGLPVIGKYITSAVVGVPPRIMAKEIWTVYERVGPAYAIPAALEKAGISVNDVDLYEINEAFASQAVFSVDKLAIPYEKVNINGGAIALGHPLGVTGARQIATLMSALKRTNKKVGVTSMCIGSGMGMAAVFERE
ncbi:unnamed protein product [Absidia cylindrospora]